MYLLLKMVTFHCYVSLPECNKTEILEFIPEYPQDFSSNTFEANIYKLNIH